MKPGLDDLGDPAVDDRARVDDDVRVARRAAAVPVRARPPEEPDRLGGDDQVVPLGDGQAEHAEPEEERHAERQPRPERLAGMAESGRPRSRPISRPMRRPTTAVTNSAVESCCDLAEQPAGRDDREVRQDREADDEPGDDPGGEQPAARVRLPRRGRADRGQGEPDEAAEGGAEEADVADHVVPRVVPSRRRRGAVARRSTPQPPEPSIARRCPPPRGADRSGRRSTAPPRSPRGGRDGDDLEAGDRRERRRRAPGRGTIARPNPSRAASRSRRSSPLTARSSPSRPTSPIATVPDRDRPVAQRRGEGEGERQVEARLVDGEAAGEVDVDVVAAEADPGPPAEDRDQQREPVRVDAARRPARRRRPDPARRAPGPRRGAAGSLEGRRDDAARRRRRRARRGTPGPDRRPRSGRASPISNTPTSSVEPKRFFEARRRRRVGVALALEGQDRVDEVLERLRAGDRAVLRDVADEDDRDPARPWRPPSGGGPTRGPGRRCRPARRARRRSAVWIESTTSRAGRSAPRSRARRSGRSRSRRRPGSPPAGAVEEARGARPGGGPGRPTPRRSRRGPAGGRRGRGDAGGGLEQERRLADPRLAADEDDASPGTSPPPRTRSSSPIPIGRRGPSASPTSARRRVTAAPPDRRRRRRAASDGRGSGRTSGLDEAVPAPQARHWPSQRRKDSPQDWQT